MYKITHLILISLLFVSSALAQISADPASVRPARFAEIIRRVGPKPDTLPATCWLKAGQNVVAIGDSITQSAKEINGFMTTADAITRTLVPERKMDRFLTRGRGGDKAVNILERLDAVLAETKPHVMIVNTGVNDADDRPSFAIDDQVSQVSYFVMRIPNG